MGVALAAEPIAGLPLSPSKTVTASLSTQATITLWVYRSVVKGLPTHATFPLSLALPPPLAISWGWSPVLHLPIATYFSVVDLCHDAVAA
jgi:hypothetical protein